MNYSPGKPPRDCQPIFEANGGKRKELRQDFRDRFYVRVNLEDKRAARQAIGESDEERNLHDQVFFIFFDEDRRDAALQALSQASIEAQAGQDVRPELVSTPEPGSKPVRQAVPQSVMPGQKQVQPDLFGKN